MGNTTTIVIDMHDDPSINKTMVEINISSIGALWKKKLETLQSKKYSLTMLVLTSALVTVIDESGMSAEEVMKVLQEQVIQGVTMQREARRKMRQN